MFVTHIVIEDMLEDKLYMAVDKKKIGGHKTKMVAFVCMSYGMQALVCAPHRPRKV